MVSLEEAVRYIQYYRQQGYSDSAIAEGLYHLGYPPQLVSVAFQYLASQSSRGASSLGSSEKKMISFPLLIGILVGVFLLLAFGGYFLFFSSSTPSSHFSSTSTSVTTTSYYSLLTTTTTLVLQQRHDFEDHIDQAKQEQLTFHYRFKFCDYVEHVGNNDLVCYPNPYDEYYLGKPIYFYFKPVLEAKKQGDVWKVGFVQSRKVYDPTGKEIPALSGTIITYQADVPEEGTYSIPAYNKIPTNESMIPGDYLITITITDTFAKKTDTIKKVISLI